MDRKSALFLLIFCGWITACQEPPPPPEPVVRPVRSIVVEAANAAVPVVVAGVTKAGVESTLSFRVSGTLIALPVAVGDRVRRGQVLARLDSVDYALAVDEAQASLAQAQASLRQAEADYDRTRALYENNSLAKADLDAARARAESAVAQVEAAKNRLAQAGQQVDYTVLRAPLAGAIAAVEVEVNETVSGGQAVIRLVSGASSEIELGVAERTIQLIEEGMAVRAELDALPGQAFDGVVTEVGVAANAGSTYPVTVRLDASTASLRSGMAAEVTFQLSPATGQLRLVVPLVAVGEDRAGRFVFVVEPGSGQTARVRRQTVTIGELEAFGVEVLSGLSIGDEVVTAGVRRLTDGMEVRTTRGTP